MLPWRPPLSLLFEPTTEGVVCFGNGPQRDRLLIAGHGLIELALLLENMPRLTYVWTRLGLSARRWNWAAAVVELALLR